MILLTHGYFLQEDPKEQLIMKPYVPLGILYISAYLENNEIENEVFDSTFQTFEKLKQHILENKPPLIGIYTNLMTKLNVIRIINLVKKELKLETKIILGGPEIRYYMEDYLKCGADMLVIGEGEETMFELCKGFSLQNKLPENIEGTAFLKGNELVVKGERKLIKDINSLPFPNRKKINLGLYLKAWKSNHGKSMVSVSTMRGCPYTCKWCSRAVYGGTYRRRSPELVAEELLFLKKNYAPDAVWFVDDVFTISHKWLNEFAEKIKEKDAKIPYEIITRADRMNEEVLKTLKESGCFRIWIGAESGSQNIIDAMDRRVDVKKVREMIILARKYGIEAGTFIMLGYPGETKSDIKETIEHLKISAPDYYTITLAYPIKGTPLYDEVKETIKMQDGLDFTTGTDRNLDFKRNYSTRYYEYAIRWVYNEVNYSRERSSLNKLKHRLKAQISQVMMELNK